MRVHSSNRRIRTAVLMVAGLAFAGPGSVARADEVQDLTDIAERAVETTVDAAVAVASFDRGRALARIDAARGDIAAAGAVVLETDTAEALGKRRGATRKRLARFDARLEKVRASLTAGADDDERVVKRLRKASRAGNAVLRVLHKFPARGFSLAEKGSRKAGYHKAGRTVKLRIRAGVHADGTACTEAPVLTLENAVPGTGLEAFEPGVTSLGAGVYELALTESLGGVRVTATACGASHSWLLLNLGPKGVFDIEPPGQLVYTHASLTLRAGDVAPSNSAVVDGTVNAFSVEPPLPAGLTLVSGLGTILGTPSAESVRTTYTVTASNQRGSTATTVDYEVTPGLPAGLVELEPGFVAEQVQTGLSMPVKMALAPDGRVFFNELQTGLTRIIDADGDLVSEPFATLVVRSGQERGLLGIALAPDFTTSGHVFVYASRPADGMQADRNQVLRYTAVGNTGTNPTVILDDLPIGIIGNAGDLQFGPDGKLYVSVGDTGVFGTSQDDDSLAGRILRVNPDGSIPADNPDPASPEWCRGLRNSFDMTFHPTAGGLFAAENGPTSDDELNFIQKGRNYEWAAVPDSIPGPLIGARLQDWTPVIVPTGIVFHSGADFGSEYAGNLFLLGYDKGDLRRLVLSGAAFTDLDAELPFALFDTEDSVDHKPLDVIELGDGSLLISTFTGIWSIRRFEP